MAYTGKQLDTKLYDVYTKGEVDTAIGNVDLTNLAPDTLIVPNSSLDPSSPVAGQIYYNTSGGIIKHFDGAEWQQMSNKFTATGGAISTFGSYVIHAFTSTGTFTALSSGEIDILLVAGGGAGNSAGGGAGGYVLATGVPVTAGTYTMTVGAGGASQYAYGSNSGSPNHGQNSSCTIPNVDYARKGQGAYGWDYQPDEAMGVYGSGAGIGQSSSTGYTRNGGYTVGQGNTGGQDGSNSSPYPSGGGGGATAVGGTGGGSTSGNGGAGVDMSSYFGTAFGDSGWFCGGGAGYNHGSTFTNAYGGQGGGGDGLVGNATARHGQANTGGGGAGGANSSFENIPAGAGGSGIILIRYKG